MFGTGGAGLASLPNLTNPPFDLANDQRGARGAQVVRAGPADRLERHRDRHAVRTGRERRRLQRLHLGDQLRERPGG